MEEDFLVKILSNIGIPSALCFYTLFEVNKNVKRLSESIDRLSNDIDRRLERLEDKTRELSLTVNSLRRGEKS